MLPDPPDLNLHWAEVALPMNPYSNAISESTLMLMCSGHRAAPSRWKCQIQTPWLPSTLGGLTVSLSRILQPLCTLSAQCVCTSPAHEALGLPRSCLWATLSSFHQYCSLTDCRGHILMQACVSEGPRTICVEEFLRTG